MLGAIACYLTGFQLPNNKLHQNLDVVDFSTGLHEHPNTLATETDLCVYTVVLSHFLAGKEGGGGEKAATGFQVKVVDRPASALIPTSLNTQSTPCSVNDATPQPPGAKLVTHTPPPPLSSRPPSHGSGIKAWVYTDIPATRLQTALGAWLLSGPFLSLTEQGQIGGTKSGSKPST